MINSVAYTQFRLDALFINYETKTGDKIEFNFANTKISKTNFLEPNDFTFQSLSEFNFNYSSINGLDENDKKEIEDFMKEVKPYINDFLNSKFNLQDNMKVHNSVNQITNMLISKQSDNPDKNNMIKKEFIKNMDITFQSFIEVNNTKNETPEELKNLEKILEETTKYIKQILKQFKEALKENKELLEDYTENLDTLPKLENNNEKIDFYV